MAMSKGTHLYTVLAIGLLEHIEVIRSV